jgi:hypothetical protein
VLLSLDFDAATPLARCSHDSMPVMPDPSPVSVVVAAWPDLSGVVDCLQSLLAQDEPATEVLVVSNETPPARMLRTFPCVRWLTSTGCTLIPHLWAQGIRAARGTLIATTTSHFVAAPNWSGEIRRGFTRSDADGIGGPIDPPARGGMGVWATFFLRYSVLFEYAAVISLPDLAADNAAYRADALARHNDMIEHGFWEPEFHRRLIAEGRKLYFLPSMRLRMHSSWGLRRFCAQRLHHGRQYGRDRLAGKSRGEFLWRVAAAPLIPGVVLAKCVRRLRHRPELTPAFVWALPPLLLFIAAWATGETWGYFQAGRLVRSSLRRPAASI